MELHEYFSISLAGGGTSPSMSIKIKLCILVILYIHKLFSIMLITLSPQNVPNYRSYFPAYNLSMFQEWIVIEKFPIILELVLNFLY